MSVLSSEDEYTEEDLLHVCEDLGLPRGSEDIAELREAIDQIIFESESDAAESAADNSLFGSLSLSDSPQLSYRRNNLDGEFVPSPVRQIDRRPLRGNYGGCRLYREVPLQLPSSRENEELRRHNPSAYFLLNEAWNCLNSVYQTMTAMENLQTKLSCGRHLDSQKAASRPVVVPKLPLKEADDDKENAAGVPRYPNAAPSSYPRFAAPPSDRDGSTASSSSEDVQEVYQPDPSLRRMGRFVPGQLLYRHDPVKKFELYREEWARRPVPGEQKRLALRWKVREYMLRHDVPVFDPRQPVAAYAVHPKDWSPRPYKD